MNIARPRLDRLGESCPVPQIAGPIATVVLRLKVIPRPLPTFIFAVAKNLSAGTDQLNPFTGSGVNEEHAIEYGLPR